MYPLRDYAKEPSLSRAAFVLLLGLRRAGPIHERPAQLGKLLFSFATLINLLAFGLQKLLAIGIITGIITGFGYVKLSRPWSTRKPQEKTQPQGSVKRIPAAHERIDCLLACLLTYLVSANPLYGE